MKKLVLLLAVVFSVSLVSCGGSAKTEATDTVAAEPAVVEEVVDSAATDSAAVEAPAEEVK